MRYFSRKRNLATSLTTAIALISLMGCAEATSTLVTDLDDGRLTSPVADEHGHLYDDGESIFGLIRGAGCTKATKAQIAYVNSGNELYEEFLKMCINKTGASTWCAELTRPNPDSADIFACTYGSNQPHRFVHPDKSTWVNAFEAVKIIEELQHGKIGVRRIYNWWRPEPYNRNVDGASDRHPHGTAIDVEFESNSDKNMAFKELCKMRSQGRIKAIGYYPSYALHFGVGDNNPNTWGKNCR